MNRLRATVRAAGLEGPALRLLKLVHPAHRRDACDDDHLRLMLAFSLRRDSGCVDVGCNQGDVLASMVRLAPAGRHYAFEPLPELADQVRRRFPDVELHEAAVSDERGEATFSRVVGAEGLSGLSDRRLNDRYQIERLTVRTVRLDDVLPEDYAPSVVKIDVEGAELGVLRGAKETLRRHRPKLWFEHGHIASSFFGATPYAVWDLLCGELGYRIFNADGVGPLDRDTFYSGTGKRMWTYFAA